MNNVTLKQTATVLSVLLLITSASMSLAQGNYWNQKSNFGGFARQHATGFSIGTKGYLGTGLAIWGGSYYEALFFKDFWEYDSEGDFWTQKADFGGGWRAKAVAFNIGDKGYMGTGFLIVGSTGDGYYYKDFWEYDPASNSWLQVADLEGGERMGAIGFSIDYKGYVGTGYHYDYYNYYSPYYTDLWEYDPVSDSWMAKADFPGGVREGAVGFSIGSKGYTGTGYMGGLPNDDFTKDFWEFDPGTNTWIQKADFEGGSRYGSSGFSIGDKGYIGMGTDEDYIEYNDLWQYDPVADDWIQKANFEGSPRSFATAFSIGSKGYIGTGIDSGYETKTDFWEYTPTEMAPLCSKSSNLTVGTITSTLDRLKWSPADEAIFYKVSYKIAGTSEWSTIQSVDNAKTLHQLTAGTEYVWKVKSICGAQPAIASEWSEKQFFATAPFKFLSVDKVSAVEVYPNPLSNSATISFSLPEAGYLTIELYDLAGRKLQTIFDGNLAGVNQEVIFHRGELISGLYVLQLRWADHLEIRKLMIE